MALVWVSGCFGPALLLVGQEPSRLLCELHGCAGVRKGQGRASGSGGDANEGLLETGGPGSLEVPPQVQEALAEALAEQLGKLEGSGEAQEAVLQAVARVAMKAYEERLLQGLAVVRQSACAQLGVTPGTPATLPRLTVQVLASLLQLGCDLRPQKMLPRTGQVGFMTDQQC